ncbi:MAG: hypothetical protein ACI8PB_005276 [Desulforhopalus sp.]|jgi:hypothetical protein
MIQDYLEHHFEKNPNDCLILNNPTGCAGIAGLSVRDFKPTHFKLVGV